MELRREALRVLETTSRTFFIPIYRLPPVLQEAVGASYLCLRAIDEIEDHPSIGAADKAHLLRAIARTYQTLPSDVDSHAFQPVLGDARADLPEVTLRIGEWSALVPPGIAPRVFDATAAMAERMASWAEAGWAVRHEADLDRYTFAVAGSVGLLLSDILAWFDGTRTDRRRAVDFGRGLQAVNIVRNRTDDVHRGADFYPQGWGEAEMVGYARRHLEQATAYLDGLPEGPVRSFCAWPHALARATLDAIGDGHASLRPVQVLRLARGLRR